jgi:hypothetical protein
MKHVIQVETRINYAASQCSPSGETVYETRISCRDGEISCMRHQFDRAHREYGGPPPHYIIESEVRNEINRMIQFT